MDVERQMQEINEMHSQITKDTTFQDVNELSLDQKISFIEKMHLEIQINADKNSKTFSNNKRSMSCQKSEEDSSLEREQYSRTRKHGYSNEIKGILKCERKSVTFEQEEIDEIIIPETNKHSIQTQILPITITEIQQMRLSLSPQDQRECRQLMKEKIRREKQIEIQKLNLNHPSLRQQQYFGEGDEDEKERQLSVNQAHLSPPQRQILNETVSSIMKKSNKKTSYSNSSEKKNRTNLKDSSILLSSSAKKSFNNKNNINLMKSSPLSRQNNSITPSQSRSQSKENIDQNQIYLNAKTQKSIVKKRGEENEQKQYQFYEKRENKREDIENKRNSYYAQKWKEPSYSKQGECNEIDFINSLYERIKDE